MWILYTYIIRILGFCVDILGRHGGLKSSRLQQRENESRFVILMTNTWRVKCCTHTHTHPFNGPFLGLPGWASTRKAKPIWILLKQATVSDSGISWAICKSVPRSRQTTTPAPQHSVFSQAGCSSCCPTNSVKALKRLNWSTKRCIIIIIIIITTTPAPLELRPYGDIQICLLLLLLL